MLRFVLQQKQISWLLPRNEPSTTRGFNAAATATLLTILPLFLNGERNSLKKKKNQRVVQ
jgi:hypothetical protein